MTRVHGGVKFYRGTAAAARSYVEAGRSRVDDDYLAEGTGIAARVVATSTVADGGRGIPLVLDGGAMDGDTYERWVAGYDVETCAAKGRLRTDDHGLRFVEVVVNGPKSGRWPRPCTRKLRLPMTRPRTGRRGRSSVGWPSIRPPGSGRVAARCKCR